MGRCIRAERDDRCRPSAPKEEVGRSRTKEGRAVVAGRYAQSKAKAGREGRAIRGSIPAALLGEERYAGPLLETGFSELPGRRRLPEQEPDSPILELQVHLASKLDHVELALARPAIRAGPSLGN